MYAMNHDFFDSFSVLMGDGDSILLGKHYPLGFFATAYLNLDTHCLYTLHDAVKTFTQEFHTFLSSRSPSSAAVAKQAIIAVWELLLELPVYHELGYSSSARMLLGYMREHPDEVDDMLTPNTGRNQMMKQWLRKLNKFCNTLMDFKRTVTLLLDDYLSKAEGRSASAYASRFGAYHAEICHAYDSIDETIADDPGGEDLSGPALIEKQKLEAEDIEHRAIPLSIPVHLSYATVCHPTNQNEFLLAEQMEFEDLSSFLYVDLLRGLSAGHIPRRCENCGKFFLLDSGYDIRYCANPAPGEANKTCRQVGAHRKEKIQNGTVLARKEYMRVYNRLKSRKNRGAISIDEWNQLVAKAQELKAQAEQGTISDVELQRRFRAL